MGEQEQITHHGSLVVYNVDYTRVTKTQRSVQLHSKCAIVVGLGHEKAYMFTVIIYILLQVF